MEIIRNTPISPLENSLPDFSGDESSLPKPTPVKTLKITDLKPAVRSENRVNVFINDNFEFSLDLAQIVDLKLKKGKVLTPEELKTLHQESEFGKLYQRTLEWLLTRPHSVQEVKDYLTRRQKTRALENQKRANNRTRSRQDREKYHLKTKQLPEITPASAERVLARLESRGYLDDRKFAAYFVENRQTKKGISRRRLEQELRKKGIDQPTISAALENSPRNETEDLKKLIQKKRPRYSDDQKLLAYLLRQGFPYDLIKSAMEAEAASEQAN